MTSKTFNCRRPDVAPTLGLVLLLACMCLLMPSHSAAQGFSSGSDGSDGALVVAGPPGTIVEFNPAGFSGSQVTANIFNFTTISIAQGVELRFSSVRLNGPVVWLAQGDVSILGTIQLSGAAGYNQTASAFLRTASIPGPGGYAGGAGGDETQLALPGAGPGGGAASTGTGVLAGGGAFSGNPFLIPLVGGSGGGGGRRNRPTEPALGPGGGAGGGALLIASSGTIVVSGAIRARGGDGGSNAPGACCASETGAGGSGGAIRLIANSISGNGLLDVAGGIGGDAGGPRGNSGGSGQIRLEAAVVSFTGSVSGGPAQQSTPFPLLLPTAGPASARVVSVNGLLFTANPSTFPDLTINATGAVDVVIETRNIPTTATVNLTILNQNGVADTVIQAPPIGNCDQSNVCSTTVPVVFPFGASRGLTRVTWVQ